MSQEEKKFLLLGAIGVGLLMGGVLLAPLWAKAVIAGVLFLLWGEPN